MKHKSMDIGSTRRTSVFRIAATIAIAWVALNAAACTNPLIPSREASSREVQFNIMSTANADESINFNPTPSAGVSLTWDASPEDVAGYRIHVGTEPGVYTESHDAGNTTSYALTGLDPLLVHYASVTAYNAAGDESGYSNEVSTRSAAVELPVVGIGFSGDDGNLAAYTLDGDLQTRWSAQGDGHWIGYDLGSMRVVRFVEVAIYNGNARRQYFDIYVSTDNASWFKLRSGASSGTTVESETYPIPETSARYVVLLGHGNSVNDWNSITEVRILGW